MEKTIKLLYIGDSTAFIETLSTYTLIREIAFNCVFGKPILMYELDGKVGYYLSSLFLHLSDIQQINPYNYLLN